jgi:hypothetical protein
MAKSTSSGEYLKTRVYRVTKAYVLVCGVVLAWVNLRGLHVSLAVSAITLPEWVSASATALAATAVALIDAVPGDHFKAALVFWRWTNPLPGSRAFERAYLDADHRIAVDKLKAHLDGKFPRAAKEQNATWYRLYKTVQTEPEVAGTHYEYLLFRDLAWFTFVLGVLATITLMVNPIRRPELLAYAGVAVVLYALFARAAFVRGHRFVRTVLAVVAARPVEKKDDPPKPTKQGPV